MNTVFTTLKTDVAQFILSILLQIHQNAESAHCMLNNVHPLITRHLNFITAKHTRFDSIFHATGEKREWMIAHAVKAAATEAISYAEPSLKYSLMRRELHLIAALSQTPTQPVELDSNPL